ncbi:MAG: EVE domain-containing protein [Gemmataceae bacterium]|jgi:predicted RNA-binding protein with PUA-like domain|nr:EVE domain-containing protein [Gemmataceae bacterium]
MATWLFKSEPDEYSIDHLIEEKSTDWNGVSNPVALKYLRAVKKGDRIFFYHTGKVKAIVGEMLSKQDAKLTEEGPLVTVHKPVRYERILTLAEVKADPVLKDWELARLPRLSVMPVSEIQLARITELLNL